MSKEPRLRTAEKILIPLLVAVIGALGYVIAAYISSKGTSQPTNLPSSTPQVAVTTSAVTVTPSSSITSAPVGTSGGYVQLKSFYNGNASGFANGTVTFTLKSEDQQGNITMQTTFQRLESPQGFASYSCQGSVTLDKQINLQCTEVGTSNFLLNVHANIFPDGHLEGKETATNSEDPTYNHVYYFTAS